jgi:hypothetical protein
MTRIRLVSKVQASQIRQWLYRCLCSALFSIRQLCSCWSCDSFRAKCQRLNAASNTCLCMRRRSALTARAGNRRFGLLSALRAIQKAQYKLDLRWRTLRALKRPRRARTDLAPAPLELDHQVPRAPDSNFPACCRMRSRMLGLHRRVMFAHGTRVPR